MRIALVGPEIEENLGLRYLAAALAANGDDARIVAFDYPHEIAGVAAEVARHDVDVIGLSMMFQLRAREFVVLAERIRSLGWRGILLAGGQHATFMATEILDDNPSFDAIVLGDGEKPLIDVIEALRANPRPAALLAVPGLVVRTDDGQAVRTACRSNRTDLESLPMPVRSDRPKLHLGLPTAPMIASRGCYASCSFCSIAAWEKLSGGPRYRVRPPEHVAREMAELYFERGVRVFNFHDDNFWFPRVDDNRERLAALERALHAERVGDIALLFKCRPTDVDRDLFAQAKDMGMVRIYVGIETDAPAGLISLRRGVAQVHNQRALDILTELDVHACSNLLLFDPDTQLGDVVHNIGFLERNARHTLNFCRVEPYGGTPLTRRLAAEERLIGDYLGYDYPLREPRIELAWRIAHLVFHDRNFPAEGLANALIGLQYRAHLAHRFWPSPQLAALRAPIDSLIVRFNLEQASLLRRIHAFALAVELSDREAVETFAAELAIEVRRSDARLVPECNTLIAGVETYASVHSAGGSSGRLGEGAAGSGWWHLGAPLASLALAACSPADADAPKPAPVSATCAKNATPSQNLLLTDPATVKKIEDAIATSTKDPQNPNLRKATGTGVTASITVSPNYNYGNGCGGGGFIGWGISLALDGPKARDYELIAISGWTAGVAAANITRANDDRWVRFQLGNPGKVATNKIGAVFRNKSAPNTELIVATDVPPDPTPPPPPPNPNERHMGCDPVAPPTTLQKPLNADRAIHISIVQSMLPLPAGSIQLAAYLDPTVNGTIEGSPMISIDGGPEIPGYASGRYEQSLNNNRGGYIPTAYFTLDSRCPNGRLPTKIRVRVQLAVKLASGIRKFSATADLQIQPDGSVTAPGAKSSSIDPLPLGRRYAGAIDATPRLGGHALRVEPPHNVEVRGARWEVIGATVRETPDPLAVEIEGYATSVVCVLEVEGGLCIASWSPA